MPLLDLQIGERAALCKPPSVHARKIGHVTVNAATDPPRTDSAIEAHASIRDTAAALKNARHYLPGSINLVYLKHRLGDLEIDHRNRCMDSSSEWGAFAAPISWHSRADEGCVHSINSSLMRRNK